MTTDYFFGSECYGVLVDIVQQYYGGDTVAEAWQGNYEDIMNIIITNADYEWLRAAAARKSGTADWDLETILKCINETLLEQVHRLAATSG